MDALLHQHLGKSLQHLQRRHLLTHTCSSYTRKWYSQQCTKHSAAKYRRCSKLVCLSQKSTDTEKKAADRAGATGSTEQDEEEKWGLFNGKAYTQPWEVPWGGQELALGMVGWGTTFVLVGVGFIPLAVWAAGPQGFSSLSQADKAYFALANQVAETVVGVGVVRLAVRSFKPLPSDFLKVDFSGPFKKPSGWLVWGLLGISVAPLLVYGTSLAVDVLGYDGVSGRGTVDSVTSMLTLDGATFAALFTTTAILAPVLEETVFRGFLLFTLTKWLPVPAAVLISAVAFGCAHFTPRDFPQLTALGVLLGLSYVRSRNLLTPMFIHGAWNGTVLTILYMLTSMGVDLESLLAGQVQ